MVSVVCLLEEVFMGFFVLLQPGHSSDNIDAGMICILNSLCWLFFHPIGDEGCLVSHSVNL